MHNTLQPCPLNVFPGCLNHPAVLIKPGQPGNAALLAFVGTTLRFPPERQPEIRLMARPMLKPEPFLLPARSHIKRHHGSFNHQRAGAAHGVYEVTTGGGDLWPAGSYQQSRCEIFLQGRNTFVGPIPPHVQAVTAEVDAERQPAPVKAGRYRHIRIFGIHRGPWATIGLESVNNAVLDSLGAILGVADGIVLPQEGNPETALHRDVLLPVHVHHAVIELIATGGTNVIYVKDHPVGQARPETGPVTAFQGAFHPDAGRRIAHGVQPERAEFVRQKVFHAFRTGYEKDRFGQDQLLVHWRLGGKFRE